MQETLQTFGNESAEKKEIVKFIDAHKNSGLYITDFLKGIAEKVKLQGNPKQKRLFEDNPETLMQIIKDAEVIADKKFDERSNKGKQLNLFDENPEPKVKSDTAPKNETPKENLVPSEKKSASEVTADKKDRPFMTIEEGGKEFKEAWAEFLKDEYIENKKAAVNDNHNITNAEDKKDSPVHLTQATEKSDGISIIDESFSENTPKNSPEIVSSAENITQTEDEGKEISQNETPNKSAADEKYQLENDLEIALANITVKIVGLKNKVGSDEENLDKFKQIGQKSVSRTFNDSKIKSSMSKDFKNIVVSQTGKNGKIMLTYSIPVDEIEKALLEDELDKLVEKYFSDAYRKKVRETIDYDISEEKLNEIQRWR